MTRKTLATFAVLAMALLLTSGVALAERVRCKTEPCRGTEQADVITGRQQKDAIFALGGDDEVAARSGDDRVNGGAGNDLIFGEAGKDRLDGGVGNDRIVGGDDADIIGGGSGNDTIDSASDEGLGPVSDDVQCGSGFDTVTADKIDKVASDCEKVTRK